MNGEPLRFSLVIGGPAYRLLARLGLLAMDELPSRRAVLLAVLLAWLPPALLSAAYFLYAGHETSLTYFVDYTAHTRYILAIAVLVITERAAHNRLMPLLAHFTAARLVNGGSVKAFHEEVTRADDRSASAIAEFVILAIVFTYAALTTKLDIELSTFGWRGTLVDGEVFYTAAGYWGHWISTPLFHFLLLRWLWRFVVWGRLLWQISCMPLRLVAYHPDRSGGLGFLSIYPTVFSGFIFALSCLVAARLVSEVDRTGIGMDVLRPYVVGWIAFIYVLFAGPLAFFVRPLYALREAAIYQLGRFGSEQQAAFEEKWVAGRQAGKDVPDAADISAAADIASIGASPYALRLVPVTLAVSVQLWLSAALPMLAVVLTQMSLRAFVDQIASAIT